VRQALEDRQVRERHFLLDLEDPGRQFPAGFLEIDGDLRRGLAERLGRDGGKHQVSGLGLLVVVELQIQVLELEPSGHPY